MNRSERIQFQIDLSDKIPIHKAVVNGVGLDRFVLDTGAPVSCLHRDVAARLGLAPEGARTARVHSFVVGGAEFGPLHMMVRAFGESRVHGLLGTREMMPYAVSLDFSRSVCVFGPGSPDHDRGSDLEIFRGRPVVHVEHRGRDLRFVLDTGSSANWLFARAQEKLAGVGEILDEAGSPRSTPSTSPGRTRSGRSATAATTP